MIKINGSLIDETHIVGVGPLMRISQQDVFIKVKFTFDLYLVNYTIEISTDRMNVTFSEDQKIATEVYERFEKEYKALYNTLQAGDWDIFKTYVEQVENSAPNKKANKKA